MAHVRHNYYCVAGRLAKALIQLFPYPTRKQNRTRRQEEFLGMFVVLSFLVRERPVPMFEPCKVYLILR